MEIQWALVMFTVVSGAGAWLFASSMIAALAGRSELPTKLESIVAFVLVAVGGCLSVLHLKHVDRILEALNHPTSGIFVEAAMIGALCVLIAVYFIMLQRGASKGGLKVVGVIAAVVAAVFTFACGNSYMMEARPAWVTITLPLAYFGTAAAAGAGLHLLMKAADKAGDGAVSFAGLLAVCAGALGAVLSAAFCLVSGSWVVAADGAVALVVVLFVACAAAIVAGALAMKRAQSGLAMGVVAFAGGVIAAILLRVVMWLIGSPILNFFLMPLE